MLNDLLNGVTSTEMVEIGKAKKIRVRLVRLQTRKLFKSTQKFIVTFSFRFSKTPPKQL